MKVGRPPTHPIWILATAGAISIGLRCSGGEIPRSTIDGVDRLAYAAQHTSVSRLLSEAEARVTLPFYLRRESEFRISKTYYVAANEPGASNDNTGLVPNHQGGRNGPFKDLNDRRIRSLLSTAEGVKMVIRQGVYRLERMGDDESGLVLRGQGDEYRPVILSGYPGETAVLDGGERLPDEQLRRIAAGQEHYTIKIRQVINVEGQYNIIENLTIRYGFRHNIGTGGKYTVIRNNILEGAYEDSIKTVRGADYGFIYRNDIKGFGSQAIDHFGANNWLIKENDIHDPQSDPPTGRIEANAIGAKGRLENAVIVDNAIHDFKTRPRTSAIVAGGGGDFRRSRFDVLGFDKAPSARHIVVGRNRIYNYRGPAIGLISCDDCAAVENVVSNTLGGFMVGVLPDEAKLDLNRGLSKSHNLLIARNSFAGNHAGQDVCRSDNDIPLGTTCFTYFVADPESLKGSVSADNKYFSDTPPIFAVSGKDRIQILTHDRFRQLLNFDHTSVVQPLGRFNAKD
jgi:hypothetical protein